MNRRVSRVQKSFQNQLLVQFYTFSKKLILTFFHLKLSLLQIYGKQNQFFNI